MKEWEREENTAAQNSKNLEPREIESSKNSFRIHIDFFFLIKEKGNKTKRN